MRPIRPHTLYPVYHRFQDRTNKQIRVTATVMFAEHRPQAVYRKICVRNLCRFYDIVCNAGIVLTASEYDRTMSAVKGALTAYQYLARSANDAGRLQWSVVNKFHWWKHLADQSQFLNPVWVWCYMGEDFVGACSVMGGSCLPGTGVNGVNRKLAERFRMARHVQLSRGLVHGD